jgi:hypothetical protein
MKKRARGKSAINQTSPTFPLTNISTAIQSEETYTDALNIPAQKENSELIRRNMVKKLKSSPPRNNNLSATAGEMKILNIPPIQYENGA